jgi:hypothetical protein
MNAGSRIIALSLLAATASDVFSLSITSKPVLIAFAKRAADHPYTYQVTTDAAAGSVTYGLETAPHGMTISPAGFRDPQHENLEGLDGFGAIRPRFHGDRLVVGL